jgi:hypothetical protein
MEVPSRKSSPAKTARLTAPPECETSDDESILSRPLVYVTRNNFPGGRCML